MATIRSLPRGWRDGSQKNFRLAPLARNSMTRVALGAAKRRADCHALPVRSPTGPQHLHLAPREPAFEILACRRARCPALDGSASSSARWWLRHSPNSKDGQRAVYQRAPAGATPGDVLSSGAAPVAVAAPLNLAVIPPRCQPKPSGPTPTGSSPRSRRGGAACPSPRSSQRPGGGRRRGRQGAPP
jgi:hypothetical protein